MKKIFLSILTIAIIVFSINSCKKEDTCNNGKQDGTETGIDCGGECIRHCYVSSLQYNGEEAEVIKTTGELSNKFEANLNSEEIKGLGLGILFNLENGAALTVSFYNDDVNAACLKTGEHKTIASDAFAATDFQYAIVKVSNSDGVFLTSDSTGNVVNLTKCDSEKQEVSANFNVIVVNETSEDSILISGSFTDTYYTKSF